MPHIHAIRHIVRLHAERNPSHRERHDEDGEKPRQKGLAFQEDKLTTVDFIGTSILLDDEVITCIGNLSLHIFERNLLWVIIDEGGASCQGNRG